MAGFCYFPQTPGDISAMLERIGVKSLDDLYSDVPAEFIYKGEYDLPEAMSEQQVRDYFESLAAKNTRLKVLAGAGAYDHYCPAVIPYITSRSEFLTAYTPYQCEISQGTLRYIFEWQSMICRLTGLDVANASMYDGPTAAAEAMRMCVACTKKRNDVVVAASLLPNVIATIETYARYSGINAVVVEDVEEAVAEGVLDLAGVIVPSINRYGIIENHKGLADLVHEMGGLLVEYCDPSALAVVKTPAEWGADIAVGDGQTLGIPLCYGGPYVGFMACRSEYMRKLPGRIVGQSVDAAG
ncbi:MAG: aminomethyl-transferring glycine dehydrogenase subunit GcvPA, partial [Bacteroidales bacterium]|nr:aminomethyl-transferring glycine dehydrogenase subunit GcvPA [Bacteroidales bacterium]